MNKRDKIKCRIDAFFWNIKRYISSRFWKTFFFFARKWYKLIEKKLGYNLDIWREFHEPECSFDINGYNYPIYVGIWRDFRDLKPYFVVAKKMIAYDTKIARIDIQTGEILHDKNIFRRLKLSEKDIQNVYKVLNHKLHYVDFLYDRLTEWDMVKYYWNDNCYDHLRYIDIDVYFDGKYDERKRKNKWFIPSDTPIPDIHYEERKKEKINIHEIEKKILCRLKIIIYSMYKGIRYYWSELLKPIYGYNRYNWMTTHYPEYLFDNSYDWMTTHYPEYLSDNKYNYPIYVGIWRDTKNLKPYFVVSKKKFNRISRIARIDFKTGEILSSKNIFKRLKLSEKDIQNVYEVLNHTVYNKITIWDKIKYNWNRFASDHLGYIDYDAFIKGKYDKHRRKNEWFISSDTPIPNIHYKNK